MNTFLVVLSSKSELKIAAVKEAFTEHFQGKKLVIIDISTEDAEIPAQPVNTGIKCATLRNEYVKTKLQGVKYDMLVSIENSIEDMEDAYDKLDACNIVLEDKYGNVYNNRQFGISGDGTFIVNEYFNLAKEQTPKDYKYMKDGLSITVGSIIHKQFPDIPANNWMKDRRFGRVDRKDTIYYILEDMLRMIKINTDNTKKLKDAIIKVPDFPKPGVLFQDLSDVLIDSYLNDILLQQLIQLIKLNVDTKHNKENIKIMGLDARGFIYGMMLASKMEFGFIMARKAGKLPGKTVQQEYGTEYSKACIEIMPHLVNENTRVIVVDDLVATGGSLKAAVDLTEKCGGTVIACVTVLQVDALVDQAKEKLGDIPLLTLVK